MQVELLLMHSHFQRIDLKFGRHLLFIFVMLPYLSGQELPLTFSGKTNPHGGGDCLVCHTKQGEPGKGNLIQGVCLECHSAEAVDKSIHMLDAANPAAEGITVPADFPVVDKKLACLTCHEVACKPDRSNQNFLRGGPYKTELDFCFQCHTSQDYQRINPHKQIKDSGEIDRTVCLQCHIKVPTAEDHPTISNAMHLDLTATCNKCHALHQHESNHQGRDLFHSRKVVGARFIKTQEQWHINLPLSADKKIQCNTCHDPHQRGVIAKPNVIYENASGPNAHFLRMSKEKLCYGCHDL